MWDWVKKYWIALVVIAFLIATVDVTISSMLTCHPSGVQSAADKANQEQCNALQGPLLLSLIWFVNSLDEHGEAVTAAFTIVLAISTIGLWTATKKLWEAGERQIEVARISAEAAKKSAEVSELALSHSRKPAIGFSCHNVSQIKVGEQFAATIQIENIGRGDAYGVAYVIKCEVVPIERLDNPFKIVKPDVGYIVLTSRDKIKRAAQLEAPLGKEDVDRIKAEKAAICIWGVVVFSGDDPGDADTEMFAFVFTGTRSEFRKCEIELEEKEAKDKSA